MKFISFFAGIGGGDKGFEAAGHECVGQIEQDPVCRRVLRHHWPHIFMPGDESHPYANGDIEFVASGDLPEAALYIVSDPCQQNSRANSRIQNGVSPRSLWAAAYLLVHLKRPTFVIRENPTLIRKDAPSSAERVAADLERIGYVCTIIDIQGSQVSGVSRQRTFVCAGIGPAGQRFRDVLRGYKCTKGDWPAHGSAEAPFAALTCHPRRYDSRDNFIVEPDGRVRVLSGRERLRGQGFPETWLECLGEVSLTRATKLTGNAWPVFMAEYIGRLVTEVATRRKCKRLEAENERLKERVKEPRQGELELRI